jgi:hypothetical protein
MFCIASGDFASRQDDNACGDGTNRPTYFFAYHESPPPRGGHAPSARRTIAICPT